MKQRVATLEKPSSSSDDADRDNVMEEVLRVVVDFERRNGEADNLPALIRQSSGECRVAFAYKLLTGVERADIEMLGTAVARSSQTLERRVYLRSSDLFRESKRGSFSRSAEFAPVDHDPRITTDIKNGRWSPVHYFNHLRA